MSRTDSSALPPPAARSRQIAFHYLGATALVGAALCLDLLLLQYTGVRASASLLFAAVLVASWQGGWGPGLFATLLAAVADDYFFIPPIHSLDFNTANLLRIGVFLFVSILTSHLTGGRTWALRDRERLLALERSARGQAESAIQMRDRFLAVTSHELRTPLTAIMMWSDLLAQNDALPEAAREGVAAISRSAKAQQRLIEDLLDISRLSSGKLRLELRPVALDEIVQAAVTDLRPAAEAKRIELSAELNETEATDAARVNGDAARLHQIITNLLGNALKFTPQGGRVVARFAVLEKRAQVQITDTGRGIAAAELPHVFDRFWQAKPASTSPSTTTPSTVATNDGLGLGLAIVRDLVQLHGGQISAASDGAGRGATFTLVLPLIERSTARAHDEIPRGGWVGATA